MLLTTDSSEKVREKSCFIFSASEQNWNLIFVFWSLPLKMNQLHPIQIISLFGLLFSAAAQFTLFLINKEVKDIWLLYPTWVVIFFLGMLLNRFKKEDEGHH